LALRPFGDRAVWIGHDPSLSRDAAGCVVIEPPATLEGVFQELRALTQRYHVTHLTLDTMGIVQGVFQLVKSLFPAGQNINFAGSTVASHGTDIHQEVYGLPEYLGALHAAWLNESATLFRRRYDENGSHAGFILYLTDVSHNEADIDTLRQALQHSKGSGNFRNLFVYALNGKKDGMQLIPVLEVTA
jgi:hypothetical protein